MDPPPPPHLEKFDTPWKIMDPLWILVLICVAVEQKRTNVNYYQWSICLCLLNNYFHVNSDISLAISTKMPYCQILTFEDDSTYKHAKDKSGCNSFLLAVLSKLVEGLSLFPYHELLSRLF